MKQKSMRWTISEEFLSRGVPIRSVIVRRALNEQPATTMPSARGARHP